MLPSPTNCCPLGCSPVVTLHDPSEQNFEGLTLEGAPRPPEREYWLGTDLLGRDLFSRLIYGARTSFFYGPILGCGGSVQGGWNWAKYCNKEIEALATKADGMASTAEAEKRIDLWREIHVKIMDDAPWVPVFNEVRFAMHSTRIGGKDVYFADPIHIPVHYEFVYAKDVE